jgi:hypothetical protein
VTFVTDDDSGSTVVLHVGQQLDVVLSQGTWDSPTSSGTSVRRLSYDGGYPTARPAHARFGATAAGNADVTAQSDAACFHTEPRCLMPTRQWLVHVQVKG